MKIDFWRAFVLVMVIFVAVISRMDGYHRGVYNNKLDTCESVFSGQFVQDCKYRVGGGGPVFSERAAE